VGSSTPFSGTGCPVGLDELSHGAPAAGHGLDAERAHAHGQALADDLLLLRLVQLATGHAPDDAGRRVGQAHRTRAGECAVGCTPSPLVRPAVSHPGRVCGPSIPGISGGTAAGGSASAQLDDVDASAV
jgi:hypothetical protein